MDEPSNTNPNDRSLAVWRRLIGLFGGDAVRRKFGDAPPTEWRVMIERLRDHQLEQGLRRLVFGGKAHVPTLPEFVKLCRTIGEADDVDNGPRAVGPALPEPEIDQLALEANRHLLAHIMRRLQLHHHRYGASEYLGHGKPLRISPELQKRVPILVKAKNAWVEHMRQIPQSERSIEDKRETFETTMREAEKVIDRMISSHTTHHAA